MENWTLSLNTSNQIPYSETDDYPLNITYILICVPIISFCVLMVGANMMVLTSFYWIKGRITTTVRISMSLAGSDVWTLILDSLGLFFNSLLPIGLGVRQQLLGNCSLLILEGLRMGGRLTTVCHLIFLAVYHYSGIIRPIHHNNNIYLTHSNIFICIAIAWVLPSSAIIAYFSLLQDDGLRHPDCTYKFLLTGGFRKVFSIIFFSSIIVMGCIYFHIYLIIKRSQKIRNQFRRAGSQYRRNNQGNERQQISNERASITTLLIVGSTVVGWMPASLSFALVCPVDCVFKGFGSETTSIAIGAVCNVLLIMKTAFNSYIYAARMEEIKRAMKEMMRCRHRNRELNGQSELRSRGGSTFFSRRTILCRIRSLYRPRESSTQL